MITKIATGKAPRALTNKEVVTLAAAATGPSRASLSSSLRAARIGWLSLTGVTRRAAAITSPDWLRTDLSPPADTHLRQSIPWRAPTASVSKPTWHFPC